MTKDELNELYNYYYDNTRNMSNNNSRHDGEHTSKEYIKQLFYKIKNNSDDSKKLESELIEKIDECIYIVNRNIMYNYLVYLQGKLEMIKICNENTKNDEDDIQRRIDISNEIIEKSYIENIKLNSCDLDEIGDLLRTYIGKYSCCKKKNKI